jgi:hypothetical protein
MYGCGNGMDICKKKCGLGAHCQGYCDCKLHSDPKSLCRKSGKHQLFPLMVRMVQLTR